MKKILKTITNVFLLSILILIIYCVIGKTKSEAALFEANNNYVKHTLQKGLNIISIDLGGPNLNKNIRKNGSYGDSTLIEQNGKYLLIDTGSRTIDEKTGKEVDNNVLIKFLKAQKVKKLSVYISHYHLDHYGKLEAILKDSYFTVEKIYLPDPKIVYNKVDIATQKKAYDSWYVKYISLLKKAGAKDKDIVLIKKNSSLNIGEAKLKVIWDYSDINLKYSSFKLDQLGGASNHYVNNTSLGAMITYKGKKLLMAGDIEEKGEQKILDKVKKGTINIKADIFKLSHHGGVSSNISAFIKEIGPKYAFMPNNAYSLANDPNKWQGDRNIPKLLSVLKTANGNKVGVNYNDNINNYATFKAFVDNNLGSKTNIYSTLYNGCILFNISTSGVITVDTTRHYKTLTVKYVDVDTKKEIQGEGKFKFCDKVICHLDKIDYIKNPQAYVYINTTYKDSILKKDATLNLKENQEIVCNYNKKKINVRYSTTNKTNGEVVVTMNANTKLKALSGWSLSSDKKSLTKSYSANKSEEIKVVDESGYTINAKIAVTNIDKQAPTASIKYSTTNLTNKSVKATITANEAIQGITGWTLSTDKKSLTKDYSANTTENVTIKDIAGNEKVINLGIKNIDKVVPTTSVKYNTTNLTKENVIVTITTNEEVQSVTGWILSSNSKTLTKTYSSNKEEIITIKDKAGNINNTRIKIKNIDKASPIVEGITEGKTYKYGVKPIAKDDNPGTLLLEKDGIKVEGYTNGNLISENGNYKLTAVDKLGNTTKINFTIDNTIEDTKGELNENNQIDIGDVLIILRHIAQANDSKIYRRHTAWRLNEKRKNRADVNGNGKIDIGDILILSRFIAAKNSKEIANKHPDWLNK